MIGFFLKFFLNMYSSASFWNMVYNFLRIGGNLLTLPIALKVLPAGEMGLYYTFGAVAGLAAFLDMGLGGTVARQVTYIHAGAMRLAPEGVPDCHPDGKVDGELFAKTVSTVRRIYTILGLIAFGLLILPGSMFIKGNLVSSGMGLSFLWAWALFALSSAHALGTGFWNPFLMGIREMRLAGILGSAAQAFYVLLVLIGLLSGLGIWSYGIALLFSGYAQRSAAKHFFLRKTSLEMGGRPDYSILRVLWPMSWRLAAVLLCMYAFQRTSVMVCSRILGLQVTASLGLAVSLFTIVFQITRSPVYITYPQISQWRVSGDLSRIRTLFYKRLYASMLMMAGALAGVILMGPKLLHFIGSKTALPDTLPLIVLAIFFFLDRHQEEYLTLVLTENKNPFIIPYAVTGLLSLILMSLGASKYGLIGLVVGQGLGGLLINDWWVVWRGIGGLKEEPDSTNHGESMDGIQKSY